MASSTFDYSACEKEPIRSPGMVQSHGVLLVLDFECLAVRASANVEATLGLPASRILGSPVERFLPSDCAQWIRRWKDSVDSTAAAAFPLGAGIPCLFILSRSPGCILLELEPETPLELPAGPRLGHPDTVLSGAESLFLACRRVVEEIARVTGFDRVMVYRFFPDWSGEVIAERRAADQVPYLGLRYPSTDIPAQARALYLRNPLRIIVSVSSLPSPLLASHGGDGAEAVDLASAQLRSVSPFHIEYLKNMGVEASLSVSLVCESKLWGLIACHSSRTRRTIPWQLREDLTLFAANLSGWIERHSRRVAAEREAATLREIAEIEESLERLADEGPNAFLRRSLLGAGGLDSYIEADSVALLAGESLLCLGGPLSRQWVLRFCSKLASQISDGETVAQDHLAECCPEEAGTAGAISGFLGCVISHEPLCVVMGFRKEQLQTIDWGGNPESPAVSHPAAGRDIGPKRSFELWRETVRGKSKPWAPECTIKLKAYCQGLLKSCKGDISSLCAQIEDQIGALDLGNPSGDEVVDRLVNGLGRGLALLGESPCGSESRILWTNHDFEELFCRPGSTAKGQSTLLFFARHLVSEEQLQAARIAPVRAEVWLPELGQRVLEIRARDFISAWSAAHSLKTSILDVRDTTTDERMRLALEISRSQALRANEAKSMMLSKVSHELRTPLNAILGFSSLAMDSDGGVEAGNFREYAGMIHEAGEHLLVLVNDLLDFSLYDSSRLLSGEEVVDVTRMLRDVLTWAEPHAQSRGISLLADPGSRACYVYCDPVRIRQAISNLISNAIKYSRQGGAVRCSAAFDPTYQLRIQVSDEGVGIPPEHLERIFDAFYQVDPSKKHLLGSTGLGLALVKAIVESHSGRITVESEVGKGSAFQILLPASRSRPSRDVTAAA